MSTEHKTTPINALVRPARMPDIPAIRLVARASWRAAYQDILDDREIHGYLARLYDRATLARSINDLGTTTLIALFGARVVGFSFFGLRSGRPEIYQLYVEPAAWGRGVGRRLMSHIEMQLMANSHDRYGLLVHRRNARAILFYQQLGFVHRSSGDRPDEWYLEKRLEAE